MGHTIRKNKSGFTLLEIVVSISIFSIVFILLVNTLFYVNKAQKSILFFYDIESGFQNVLNKMTLDIEENSLNYALYPTINIPENTLYLLTRDNLPLVYRLNNKKIEFSMDGGISFNPLNESNTVEVNSLNFYIIKDSENKIALITFSVSGNYIDQFNTRKSFNYQLTTEQKLYIK